MALKLPKYCLFGLPYIPLKAVLSGFDCDQWSHSKVSSKKSSGKEIITTETNVLIDTLSCCSRFQAAYIEPDFEISILKVIKPTLFSR